MNSDRKVETTQGFEPTRPISLAARMRAAVDADYAFAIGLVTAGVIVPTATAAIGYITDNPNLIAAGWFAFFGEAMGSSLYVGYTSH